MQVSDRQAITTGGSNLLREPADPTRVVVIGVGEQLVLKGSQELADGGVVPVPRKVSLVNCRNPKWGLSRSTRR